MRRIVSFLIIVLFSSCNLFKPEQKPESIARVGKNYLFKSDIKSLVPAGTSKKDSVLLLRDYINRWATQKILIEAAEINLSDKKKAEFSELIKQYKNDLYVKAYEEDIVKQSVDTIISEIELKDYYEKNKQNFKTNGSIIKMRFVNIIKDNPNVNIIRSKFFNSNKKDRQYIASNTLQLKSFALNDSVWVDVSQVYNSLPFITPENKDDFLIPGKNVEKLIGNEYYFLKTVRLIGRNQISPFEYIKPTLKEIILNQRKLELVKKLEIEIISDAIKNKNYEIY